MEVQTEKRIEYLVVDTSAFIRNAPLQTVGKNIITTQNVVNEIKNTRQLRSLCVLPYDLTIKDVFAENIRTVTEFAKKTGDYPNLSSVDIQLMALTYQLEKEHVGSEHIRTEPTQPKSLNVYKKQKADLLHDDVVGFYIPGKSKPIVASRTTSECENDNTEQQNELDLNALNKKFGNLDVEDEEYKEALESLLEEEFEDALESLDEEGKDILVAVNEDDENSFTMKTDEEVSDEDDADTWITPSNLKIAKQKAALTDLVENKPAKVACMTTDFSMQNVLKQMNLNVCTLDGLIIRQLRTFILRCYGCFTTTSIMTKRFCPKCGNNTLKRVGVSLDENGKQVLHINGRKQITGRGKIFSMPTIKGGRHANNPIVAEDQPVPQQRASRLQKMKNNPMGEEYMAGFSPFVTRDITSRSAALGIRADTELKHRMQNNPNHRRRLRKK